MMTKETGVIRLHASGDVENGLSQWITMPFGGEFGGILEGQPKERFHRVFDTIIQSPTEVRAGVWEATIYSEKLTDYPYNEIIFLLEGNLSIIDSNDVEERFDPGDCFFLKKGFNGVWKQHGTIKIFHMTVDPKQG